MRRVATIAAAYAVLAVALTWPLAPRIATVLPHDLGDPVMSTTALWWNAHVTPLTTRWWDGPAFFPAAGTLALSDHRLGESLIATPLQWAGASAVSAYNLTLLATFPLCALAAWWLAFTLTLRSDAAWLCGLAYGFNPYRVAHIEHLELLAAFGMPAALAALHRYARTRRPAWLILFAAALLVQGLCSTYYTVFFAVLLAMWMVWFLRRDDLAMAATIVIAAACTMLALTPIAIGYSRVHEAYGVARRFSEIQWFSGDLTSLVTASPLVWLWGWTSSFGVVPERQLFPGFTIMALTMVGVARSLRNRIEARGAVRSIGVVLTALALVFALVGASALWFGPWMLGPLAIRGADKPLSIAVVLAALPFALHPRVLAAYRHRSAFGFYVAASVVLFVCSLGPTPTFRGAPILYRAPYWWLMHLPVFSYGIRVPARFAMLAWLALSVAAALAYARLPIASARRGAVIALLSLAILSDGWMRGLALQAVPEPWPAVDGVSPAAVLQLPTGDPQDDAVAMYRATQFGAKAVNGLSGYDPLHYVVLRLAIGERDGTVIAALAEHGPILIAVNDARDRDRQIAGFLKAIPGVTVAAIDRGWTMYRVAARQAAPAVFAGRAIPVVAAEDNNGPVDVGRLTDGNPHTFWVMQTPQFVGQTLRLDVGRAVPLASITLSLGGAGELYPRALSVATSADGTVWSPAFAGSTAGDAFRAVLKDPRDARLEFPLQSAVARFVRLRLERTTGTYPWMVTDVVVKQN